MRRIFWGPFALLLFSSLAAADDEPAPDRAIQQVREQIVRAHYDDAIDRAQELLSRSDLDAAQRNTLLETLATAHIANRDEERALSVLKKLYRRDPGYRLDDPDASPLVQSMFARARRERPEPIEVQLVHEPPQAPITKDTPRVAVEIAKGASALDELRLAYRAPDMADYGHIVMNRTRGEERAHARIPVAAAEQQRTVRYYFEALAPSGTVIGRRGSPSKPLQLTVGPAAPSPARDDTAVEDPQTEARPVAPPADRAAQTPGSAPQDEPPLRRQWWLWTLVGVAVAGVAAGGYVLFGPPSQSPTGSLGALELR